MNRQLVNRVSFEELLVATGGYGVSKIAVCVGSTMINQTLRQSNLRSMDINVLAIVRQGHTMPNPSAETQILDGDELICFGNLDTIRREMCNDNKLSKPERHESTQENS